MVEDRVPGFATLAVHAGTRAGAPASDGSDAAPAFAGDDVRLANPLQAVLEERIAALEGGSAAVAVASGHAARQAALQVLMQPGDELVAARQLDGGARDQFGDGFASFGWQVRWADIDDLATFADAVSPKTKAMFVAAVANPGGVADIEGVASLAKRAGVPLIVDNTLATPALCRPLDHGADIVIHATTRYIGGHGSGADGGLIVDGGRFNWLASARYPLLSDKRPEFDGLALAETYGNFAYATACRVFGLGDAPPAVSPFDAEMLLAGVETLALRMRAHSDNARAVAEHLAGHDRVTWVRYPGLAGDRHHNLARRYAPEGAGAVLTFAVEGGAERADRLLGAVRLFSRDAADGDARSTIDRPWATAFRRLAEDERTALGAGPDALRLTVGLEDAADLTADLDQALAAA